MTNEEWHKLTQTFREAVGDDGAVAVTIQVRFEDTTRCFTDGAGGNVMSNLLAFVETLLGTGIPKMALAMMVLDAKADVGTVDGGEVIPRD